MRKVIINMAAFGIACALLPKWGITVQHPAFWVVLVALMVVQANNSID